MADLKLARLGRGAGGAAAAIPFGTNGKTGRVPWRLRPEPKALGQLLLERGLLTHFQLNLLFQGRVADLLLGPYVVLTRSAKGEPALSSRPGTCACSGWWQSS